MTSFVLLGQEAAPRQAEEANDNKKANVTANVTS